MGSTKPRSVNIEVDATISAGHFIEVFLNNRPSTQIIDKGKRTHYIFSIKASEFDQIRLDPTDSVDSDFSIHGIIVKDPDGKVLLETRDFANWEVLNAKKINSSKYLFSTTTSDSMLISPAGKISYKVSTNSYIQTICERINKISIDVIVFTGIICFFLLIGVSRKNFILLILFSLIYFSFSHSIFQAIQNLPWPMSPATESVGWTNFHGYEKIKDFVFFTFMVSVFGAFGLFVHRFFDKFYIDETGPISTNTSLISKFEIVTIILFFAIFETPNFSLAYDKILNARHVLNWDEMNVFTWKVFYEIGQVPLKDFWYPYGNQNLTAGPFWQDLAATFFHRVFYFSLFLSSLVAIFERNRFPIWLTVFAFCLFNIFDLNLAADRYFFSFSVYAFAYSIRHREVVSLGKLFVFFVACTWLFLWEPHQFIYTLFGLMTLAFIDLFTKLRVLSENKNTIKIYIKLFTVAATSLTTAIFIFAYQDRWQGLINFLSQTSGYSNNAAIPVDFMRLTRTPYLAEGNIFHLYFLSIAIACFGISSMKLKNCKLVYFLCGSTSLILPFIIKNLIRPHISRQVIGIQLIALCIYFLSFPNSQKRIVKSKLAIVFLGFLCGYIFGENSNFNMKKQLVATYHSLESPFLVDTKYFSADKKELVKTYYSPDRSYLAGISLGEISDFVKNSYPKKSVFVLGDFSAIYTAIETPAPYTISFYDGAHIQQQKSLLSWLQQMNIDIIIWNPAVSSFDEVPFIVKNPELFKYVVQNYTFDRRLGDFHFLKRKTESLTLDMDYWIKYIGNKINFGFLALNQSGKNMENCDSGSQRTECVEYLQIRPTPEQLEAITLGGHLGSKPISIVLLNKGNRDLLLPTSAIWFWEWINTNKSSFFKNKNYSLIYKKKERDFIY